MTPQGDTLRIDIDNRLEAVQAEVGGYIVAQFLNTRTAVITNEDAKTLQMPRNERASRLLAAVGEEWAAGPALLVGVAGEELTDVPEDMALVAMAVIPSKGHLGIIK